MFLQGAPFMEGERAYSERTAREIDVEVRRIIDQSTQDVREMLRSRRDALEAIAQKLVEKEVIDGGELRQMLEQFNPGPRLVPGSDALHSGPRRPEITIQPSGGDTPLDDLGSVKP
jgi:cell division protease FtsH